MDDFVEYVRFVEEYRPRPNNFRIPKRFLRDPENPLEMFDDEQFFNRYRFSKGTFVNNIFPMVKNEIESVTFRGQPLPPVLKVLAVLRFYATGNYQIDTGDSHCMSQPTICVLVKNISLILARQLPKFVKFPATTDMARVKRKFYSVAGFPGVVGCIDCTHVPIQNPYREGGEIFRNRKGHFSINVQLVSGPNGEIFDLVARWPGSTHDSRIFDNSSVKVKFEQKHIQGILLGDSGYAQNQYLFTPVLNPQGASEERYNHCQSATRCIVERLFGMWKRRFSCLKKQLAYKLSTTTHIISACAVLHNIAVMCREQLPPVTPEQDLFENDEHQSLGMPSVCNNRRGAVIKRAFIAEHFG